MATSTYFDDFSAYTAANMAQRGSLKWTAFPGTIGAWIAEMDFGISPAIAQTIRAEVDKGAFGYLPICARDDAKAATARWHQRRYGWDITPEQVCLFPDVLTVLEATILHFLEPGQPVVVPTPSYMPFLTQPKLFKREIIEVPGLRDEAGHYTLDLDGIDAALATSGGLLILCNPWNPVGRVLTREELQEVEAIIAKHDARVFADEIHGPVVLDPERRHIPYASISPTAAAHTITATSNSKGWNIPGLKCAQMIVSNDHDAAELDEWIQHYEHLASPLGVKCAVAAYDASDDWLAEVTGVLRANRDLFAARLAEALPDAVHAPAEGTYLAWVDLRPYGCEHPGAYLLEQAKVAINDGEDCGAPGHARINLAMAPDNCLAVVDRMARALTGE